MIEQFKALILTYKSAPVEIREQVSLQENSVKELIQYLKSVTSANDLLIISTCNRTEFYYTSTEDFTREIFVGLALIRRPEPGFEQYFEHLQGLDAVRHLFYVGVGLDAQVIGDLQISGQVKSAYQWTADCDAAGPFLHRLMHTVFFVNKRIVQETGFRDGAASLSYAAKELAAQLTSGYLQPSVLLVGAGEIARDIALNLKDSEFQSVTILNRTMARAESLARSTGFRFSGIESLATEIEKADVVFSSVAGTKPLIDSQLMDSVKVLRPKFFIDLSMPRSVAPELEQFPGLEVYNLDDLHTRTSEVLAMRQKAIPRVEQIIDEVMAEFSDWSREITISPVIQKIKQALEQIRREELARWLRNATPQEARQLEEMSSHLVQRILKYPVLQLKAACRRGDAGNLAEVLQELFDLEKHKSEKNPRS